MRRLSHRRQGFTLLEMLLSSAIAMLLMAALYVTMEMQVRLASAGRDRVEQGTLSRQILARLSQDISGCLTPITATKSTASSSATSSSTGSTTSGDISSLSSVIPFNCGVEGDLSIMTVYCSKVPGKGTATADPEMQGFGTSDIRRVTYWLASSGGLARQELDRVTADDESSQLPPYVDNEEQYIIAPEVVEVTFRYFDGSSWYDSWSGSTVGADEVTPIGPPRAIEINLTLKSTSTDGSGEEKLKTYRHVVAIGAANAQPVQSLDTTGTTSSSSSSSSSGSTSGGSP